MICSRCGKEFNGKFCEHCGAPAPSSAAPTPSTYPTEPMPAKKKKKPIYKRWWFYVIVVIAAIAVISSISGNKSEKIKWDDIILSEQLPEPPKKNGKINDNTAEALSVEIYKISDKQFNNYVEACKAKGFTVDSESDYSSSYDAYNAAGYKLSLGYYGSRDQMEIELEKPIEMSAITWPTSKAGKQLPAPKSTTGKFSYENDDGFSVYIGNTSKDDYNSYVKACSDKGFTVNYDKADNFYNADNSAGWHVSIKYEGNNIMSIDIDAASENSTAPSASKDTTKQAESKPTESKPERSSAAKTNAPSAQGVSKYETIYNEYAQKIRDAAPTSSISELAEIANEGVGKMAEYMWTAKGTDGQYATYEEWSGKLMDVYMSEAR